jgi:hypothetical protein
VGFDHRGGLRILRVEIADDGELLLRLELDLVLVDLELEVEQRAHRSVCTGSAVAGRRRCDHCTGGRWRRWRQATTAGGAPNEQHAGRVEIDVALLPTESSIR